MKRTHKLMICIGGMAGCSILIPLFLDYIIWANNMESSISNSDWSGFLGSFLGGIIGGIGTLIAVYITTLETRSIQKETNIQNKSERDKNYQKEKFWHFVEQLATYYMNLEIIRQKIDELMLKYEKKNQYKNDINSILNDINNMKENEHQTHRLEKRKNEKEMLLDQNNIIMESLKTLIIQRCDNLKYGYLIFKIVTCDISGSCKFLIYIKDMETSLNELCEKMCNERLILDKNDELYKKIISQTSSFEEQCKILLKEFEKNII